MIHINLLKPKFIIVPTEPLCSSCYTCQICVTCQYPCTDAMKPACVESFLRSDRLLAIRLLSKYIFKFKWIKVKFK